MIGYRELLLALMSSAGQSLVSPHILILQTSPKGASLGAAGTLFLGVEGWRGMKEK